MERRTYTGAIDMADNAIPTLATTGEVAKTLGVPPQRIEYILRTRPHIRPRAIAAGARCFDDTAIGLIRDELDAIAERRLSQGGAA